MPVDVQFLTFLSKFHKSAANVQISIP